MVKTGPWIIVIVSHVPLADKSRLIACLPDIEGKTGFPRLRVVDYRPLDGGACIALSKWWHDWDYKARSSQKRFESELPGLPCDPDGVFPERKGSAP